MTPLRAGARHAIRFHPSQAGPWGLMAPRGLLRTAALGGFAPYLFPALAKMQRLPRQWRNRRIAGLCNVRLRDTPP